MRDEIRSGAPEQRLGKLGADPSTRSDSLEEVLHLAEALLRFSGEVDSRMVASGVGGVGGVIERYAELRTALSRVSQRELDWARGEIERLVRTLSSLAEQLEQLDAIKRAIGDPH